QEGLARPADLHPDTRHRPVLHRPRCRTGRAGGIPEGKPDTMNAELWLTGAAILVCIVLSFLFSGSETALTAVSRARMQSLENSGTARAATVNLLIAHRDRLIGALLIGNNIVNILASALATSVFLQLFGQAGIAYATVTMTVLLVVFAEVLPKSWAIAIPERFALAVAPLVRAYLIVAGPLSALVNA